MKKILIIFLIVFVGLWYLFDLSRIKFSEIFLRKFLADNNILYSSDDACMDGEKSIEAILSGIEKEKRYKGVPEISVFGSGFTYPVGSSITTNQSFLLRLDGDNRYQKITIKVSGLLNLCVSDIAVFDNRRRP